MRYFLLNCADAVADQRFSLLTALFRFSRRESSMFVSEKKLYEPVRGHQNRKQNIKLHNNMADLLTSSFSQLSLNPFKPSVP